MAILGLRNALVHAIEAELALKKEQAAADLGTADGACSQRRSSLLLCILDW